MVAAMGAQKMGRNIAAAAEPDSGSRAENRQRNVRRQRRR
jgi:hypothetical protein